MNKITSVSPEIFGTLVPKNDGSGEQSVLLSLKIKENTTITLYRRIDDKFTFGVDYESYFDNLVPSESDVIYRGSLEFNGSVAEFSDEDVEMHKVYIYWVSTADTEEETSAPFAIKVRDSRIWWHYDEIQKRMKGIEDRCESAEIVRFGETVGHKALNALLIGNRENMVAGIGVVHAGESGPEILISAAEKMLDECPELLGKVGLAILPLVNADMREKLACGNPWYIRKNGNGVDLNRNFDGNWHIEGHAYGESTADPGAQTYRGPHPNSEPETQAVINFIETISPIITLSYHWLASITCDSFLCGRSYDDTSERHKRFCDIARPYSNAFRRAAGTEVWGGRMVHPLGSNGGLGEWGYCHGYYTMDLEGAYFGGKSDQFKVTEHDGADYKILCECIELHKSGLVAMMENIASENEVK